MCAQAVGAALAAAEGAGGRDDERIAAGAGVTVQDVNALMRQFDQMRQMVKQMMGNKKGAMRRMAAGMNRPPFR